MLERPCLRSFCLMILRMRTEATRTIYDPSVYCMIVSNLLRSRKRMQINHAKVVGEISKMLLGAMSIRHEGIEFFAIQFLVTP